jgi:hypothetical protein
MNHLSSISAQGTTLRGNRREFIVAASTGALALMLPPFSTRTLCAFPILPVLIGLLPIASQILSERIIPFMSKVAMEILGTKPNDTIQLFNQPTQQATNESIGMFVNRGFEAIDILFGPSSEARNKEISIYCQPMQNKDKNRFISNFYNSNPKGGIPFNASLPESTNYVLLDVLKYLENRYGMGPITLNKNLVPFNTGALIDEVSDNKERIIYFANDTIVKTMLQPDKKTVLVEVKRWIKDKNGNVSDRTEDLLKSGYKSGREFEYKIDSAG